MMLKNRHNSYLCKSNEKNDISFKYTDDENVFKELARPK